MNKVHIIEVIKEKTPYNGTSSTGRPFTIFSKRALVSIDGGPNEEIEVKSFKEELNAATVAGAVLMCEYDTKSNPKYGKSFAVKSVSSGGATPATGHAPAAQSYGGRDLSIQAQCCLKAATEIVSATLTPDDNKRLVAQAQEVLDMADIMLGWVESRAKGEKRQDAATEVPDDLPFK